MSMHQARTSRTPTRDVTAIPTRGVDDTLLERVAGGDPDALGALFDRLGPSVHGLALRVVRESSLAEDVTQDVFLDVWLKAARFDRARGSARTWIMTIAHRRAVDVVRHEQSARDRLLRSTTVVPQQGHDVVSEEVLSRATAVSADRQLTEALGTLTELQRTAIDLAYFGGLTYAQVAQRLDIPLPTAKTRIRDGLRRLAHEVTPTTQDDQRSAAWVARPRGRGSMARRAAG